MRQSKDRFKIAEEGELMKYFWLVFSPLIFFAAFCNLATGVLVFGYVVFLKSCFWILSEDITSRSPRRFFYTLLAIVVMTSSILMLKYGEAVIPYWPHTLLALFLLWLVIYQRSEQRAKDLEQQRLWLSRLYETKERSR